MAAAEGIHLGELSAARQALTAGPLAPGTQQTLVELRDPVRRPQEEYGPLAPEVMAFEPDRPADIPITMILRNLRRARKGAAPGPSGLTTDTLRLLLDDETSTAQLGQVTQLLAQARVPPTIATAIALGRLVALQKPNGRVRGIVVGDTLRAFGFPLHGATIRHHFPGSVPATPIRIVNPRRY